MPPAALPLDQRTFGAVLFDMDGTLIDSIPAVERSWLTWAAENSVAPELLLGFHGVPALGVIGALLPDLDAAGRQASFALRLTTTGCFPNAHRPRVVWVGLGGEAAALAALVAGLNTALGALGLPPEDKPFRAHLTLGRVKDERAAQEIDWSAAVPALNVPVAAIRLIESQLRPDGPVYTVRHTSQLGEVGQ